MKISDIKIHDEIQVFSYESLRLELYRVCNIYSSEDGEKVFDCFKLKFNDKKEIIQTNFKSLIKSCDVMGIYKEIQK